MVSSPSTVREAAMLVPAVPVRDVIRALYRTLLLREPDQEGWGVHGESIANGSLTLEEVIGRFFQSREFQSVGHRVFQGLGLAGPVSFTNDHSQYGEFGILLRHWVNDAALHRIVVDVGAHGRERSNSYDLLRQFGWRGLLIEANPALIETIRNEFAGLDFDVLNYAISNYDGSATFHLGIHNGVSSLNADAALSWGNIRGEVEVDVRRLDPLLRSRNIPPDFDLLSLDIEGEDLKVFNDLIGAGLYRPRWVIIEASYNFSVKSLDDLQLTDAVKAAYSIAGQTVANLILRRTV